MLHKFGLENPLCFELNFKKSKMYSVTLQSVILKHFENGSKVFLKWVVWKRPIEKTIWVVLFQILFERCSKCFQDIWQKFENFGSTVCIWKQSTFGLESELSLISKQNLKRKGLSWFQKCISKRSLPKWFEWAENCLIWFPKSFIPKRTWTCVLSLLFDFKRKWELKTHSLYF